MAASKQNQFVARLEKDLNKILKKIKNTNKYNTQIKEQHANMQMNIENSEMLDLKAELCQLKSKLLQQDQKRIQEVTSKNLQIAQLERKINEE